MCGIVAAISHRPITSFLLDGLKKLEYRGYDSAGTAILDKENAIQCIRVVGKVRELEIALTEEMNASFIGIAHTRWATHGMPSEKNAHPHLSSNKLALVHNGIIENHIEIRHKLTELGFTFLSDTDTEVAAHLIHHYFNEEKNLLTAVKRAITEFRGAYALALLSADCPDRLIGVKQGAPLVIGKGEKENFLASDPLALLTVTQEFIYLEDNDVVEITRDHIAIYNQNRVLKREAHTIAMSSASTERGKYKHYMQKEIMEQPDAIKACLDNRVSDHLVSNLFANDNLLFAKLKHIHFVACGTSYHAALIARYWIEALTHIPCTVEVASEFRYRDIATYPNSLFVALSQSGETADTLAALKLAKKMTYLTTLIICNAPGSTMAREADLSLFTHAGIEIGVASTKAFVTQLVALLLLALFLKQLQDKEAVFSIINELKNLPALIHQILIQDQEFIRWAKFFINKQHALFLGRGALYPVALEGALKMKEISYIHAEAYPAGELKHGPLALVDNDMPIVAIVPNDHLLEKNLSNLQEVKARGGQLFILTHDKKHLQSAAAFDDAEIIALPKMHPLFMPISYTIPLQLLAYHVAVLKGTDVDQPRNLAKSVTVE